jgi:MFS family permease
MGTVGVFAQLGVAFSQPRSSGGLVLALVMSFFMLLATPITSIVGKSLLSKITPVEDQGFYQGLLSSTQQLGLISGPLVGSALFTYLIQFSSTSLFVFVFLYVLTLTTMDKLV